MCTFINSLPTQSKTAESAKKKNLALFIRPSKEKEFYKFRLLAFKSPQKSDRDYPFIERYVHQHWAKDENGKSKIDAQVICPVTKYVKTEGNPYDACPICKYANMNFVAWKESGWKDRESAKKNKEFGRKFEAIIPVYVTNDPNYELNRNKFKVLIFTDKDFYKKFKEEIKKASRTACCFNGGKAVDFYMHMSVVPKVVNEGTPNQYVFNEKVIDRFGFTKPEKAYEIPAINKEAIDAFEFDETYYVSSTPEELQDFYDRFIKASNDDIPDEDLEVYEAPKAEKPAKTNKPVETPAENVQKSSADDVLDDIDDLTSDPDDLPATNEESKKEEPKKESTQSDDISDDDLNDLVDGLDDI